MSKKSTEYPCTKFFTGDLDVNLAKKPRPQALPSQTLKMPTACGPIYVTITHDDDQIQEVFIRYGQSGGCSSAIGDGMAKVISYALRSGMEPSLAIKALAGISCHLGKNTCMHAIAMAVGEEMGLPVSEDRSTPIEKSAFRAAPVDG